MLQSRRIAWPLRRTTRRRSPVQPCNQRDVQVSTTLDIGSEATRSQTRSPRASSTSGALRLSGRAQAIGSGVAGSMRTVQLPSVDHRPDRLRWRLRGTDRSVDGRPLGSARRSFSRARERCRGPNIGTNVRSADLSIWPKVGKKMGSTSRQPKMPRGRRPCASPSDHQSSMGNGSPCAVRDVDGSKFDRVERLTVPQSSVDGRIDLRREHRCTRPQSGQRVGDDSTERQQAIQ